jgi:phytol kinase
VIATALLVRRSWPEQREWSRKVVHIGTGPVVLIAWGLGIDRWLAIAAAAVMTGLAVLNHRTRVLPAIEDVDRASFGTVAYGASITLMLLLWWPGQAAAAAAGVMVMALGDGLAGLLGPQIVSPSWRVLGERRSLVGTAAMALASLAALAMVAGLAPQAAPAPVALVLIALGATALEQVAWLGIDNLTVPLLVGGLWNLWR